MSRKVPSNCLGNIMSTRCIQYDGAAFPDIDIQSGDSLEWVLAKIIENLGAVASSTDTTYDMSCLAQSGTSECGALIQQRTLTIGTTSSTGGVTVTWNVQSIETGLPSGYSIQTAQVLLRGIDGSVQFSGSQISGQVAIPLSVFPLTMDYRLYIFTPCGNIELTRLISVSSDPGAEDIQLTLVDVAAAASSVNSDKDAIELLAREVCALKNEA